MPNSTPNCNPPNGDLPNRNDAQLWLYLDGEMHAKDAEALERDCALDTPGSILLAERLDNLRLIADSVLDGAPSPPTGFGARVAAASKLQGSTPRSAEILDLQRFVRRALIAAALLAAIGLGYLAFEVLPDLVSTEVHAGSDPLLGPR